MILSRPAQQGLTASIAILAVLLLFMMPVVSTSLAEPSQVKGAESGAALPAAGFVHHHDVAMQTSDVREMPAGSRSHDVIPDNQLACGYCDLLVHVPLILWLFTPLIWLITWIACVLPRVTLRAPVTRHPYGFPHSRAPPQAFASNTSSA